MHVHFELKINCQFTQIPLFLNTPIWNLTKCSRPTMLKYKPKYTCELETKGF